MKISKRKDKMMKSTTSIKYLAINAMVACIYASCTLVLAPLSFMQIQLRFSEIFVFLAFYNKKYIPGLVIGCLLANTMSPLGIIDVLFGTFSTILVCIAMHKLQSMYTAAFVGSVITGIIIGFELYYALNLPFIINAVYVFAGEFLVLLIGAMVFQVLIKNEKIAHLLG